MIKLGPLTEGIYDLSYADYDADPAPKPSMRAGHAKSLCYKVPIKAWRDHARLNPDRRKIQKTDFDIGIAAHALVVGGEERIEVIEAADYRTKAAREARDEAYAAGRTPILEHQLERVQGMAVACRAQLDARGYTEVFGPKGLSEQSIIYRDGRAWCRSRPDWFMSKVEENGVEIVHIADYKTTGLDALFGWDRAQFDEGTDMQAEMQCRAVAAVTGADRARIDFCWVVQETSEPFDLVVKRMSAPDWVLAGMLIDHATESWANCLDSGVWPGYPTQDCQMQRTPWQESRAMEVVGEGPA